jgi:uncharacterized protein
MDTFHSGEREAQQRAGVRSLAEKVGRIISPTIPAAAAAFLAQRSFLVSATVAASGEVHASILSGSAGFSTALDPLTIRLRPSIGHQIAVRDLQESSAIGLLAIDFATRRRMRVNGTALVIGQDILVSTQEVYSNCPQYILTRDELVLHDGPTTRTERLTDRQVALVATADTFFIASSHPQRGADASHRGGPPGFVSVTPDRMSWLDFPGNNMFNTLGNLLVHERCSLLFVNFHSGGVLRIDGRASIEWSAPRRVEVAIDGVFENAITAP